MDEIQLNHLKGAVEALLFVSEKPVALDQMKEAIAGSQKSELQEALAALKTDYATAGKGIMIAEIAGGYQMLSSQMYAGYIREFYKTRHKEKLSKPSLEVLAIIAYKQPVSRTDVELVRGVNSDGVVMHLLNKGLIKIAGRKEVPGRPYVYGTTTAFLEYFGLRALEDLPKLEDFPALMAANAQEVQPTSNPAPEAVPAEAGADSAAPLSAAGSGESLEDAERRLQEELARARTRLDIEQLEKETQTTPIFMEPDQLGESSGQARIMEENREAENGPDASA